MQRRSTGPTPMTDHDDSDDRYDLDELLHPANAFSHPWEVVNDPDLTLSEKRAILASWASDACAVEAAPALRRPPGKRLVAFDDIMDALRELDRQAGQTQTALQARPRQAASRGIWTQIATVGRGRRPLTQLSVQASGGIPCGLR